MNKFKTEDIILTLGKGIPNEMLANKRSHKNPCVINNWDDSTFSTSKIKKIVRNIVCLQCISRYV